MSSETRESVIGELVVERGLSYADAITEAERLAVEAAAPYRDAAREMRGWLAQIEERQRGEKGAANRG